MYTLIIRHHSSVFISEIDKNRSHLTLKWKINPADQEDHQMHPSEHARLMNVYGYIILCLLYPLILICFVVGLANGIFLLVVFALIGGIYLSNHVLMRKLVYCEQPGCHSRMSISKYQVSTFGSMLRYECLSCMGTYEEKIMDPISGRQSPRK